MACGHESQRINVYFVDNHMNTHGKPPEVVNAWYASSTRANSAPIVQRSAKAAAPGHLSYEYTFTIPSDSTAPHYYFYVRAVNVLGQEGQKTDIVSKTSDASVRTSTANGAVHHRLVPDRDRRRRYICGRRNRRP